MKRANQEGDDKYVHFTFNLTALFTFIGCFLINYHR